LLRVIVLFLLFFSIVNAQTLEERVQQLERKVKQLEERLNRLEGKTISSENITVPEKNQELIGYKVLSKKFKPMRLKESFWQKADQILLKMVFKNNTGKELENIKGRVIIYDKNGNKLMEKVINVNKALNFFKGMTIKPEEEVKKTVEIDYDRKNEKHRKVKELPLKELVVKFYPSVIKFADGTEKYIKYREQ